MGQRGKGSTVWVHGAVLALALWLAGATSAGSVTSAPPDGRRGDAGSGAVRRALAEPCAPIELRRRLANLDKDDLPQLFFYAAEGRLPGLDSSADGARAESKRQIVRESLSARPRRELVPFLEDLASRPQSTSVRLEAQRLLGDMGSGDHLKLLARVTVPASERGAIAPELRSGFVAAECAILARDPAALAQIPALISESPPGLGSSIVEGLAQLGSTQATRVLAALLGRTSGLDPLLLARLAERGRLRTGGDEAVFEPVRRYLRQRDPNLVSAAARACGQLGDDGAVETLVGLMEHSEDRVRAATFDALQRISGLAFGPDPARWMGWYHAEMRWWDEEAESMLVNIERGRGLEFVRAAREALEHRLYRDRIAESFTRALSRKNPEEVRLACRALEQLGSTQAVSGLIECLERDDPLVREAAWRALRSITGVELSPEAGSWAELAQ